MHKKEWIVYLIQCSDESLYCGVLEALNLSLGIYIIDHLVQKGVNRELHEDCCAVSGNDNLSEEEGAFVIIDKLWKRLQETHRLRTVK